MADRACGQMAPNVWPSISCIRPKGHGGAHAGPEGRPQWLRSVERQHGVSRCDRCAGCGTEITQRERDTDDVRVHDDDQEYHWACLQERYELDRLADEEAS